METKDTILLVEDDRIVRTFARLFLTRLGYEVIEAVDADDAKEKFDEQKEKIRAVFSDFFYPGGDAPVVIKHIRDQFPDFPILIATGAISEWSVAVAGTLFDDGTKLSDYVSGIGVIGKPYDNDSLRTALIVLLAKPGDPGPILDLPAGPNV